MSGTICYLCVGSVIIEIAALLAAACPSAGPTRHHPCPKILGEFHTRLDFLNSHAWFRQQLISPTAKCERWQTAVALRQIQIQGRDFVGTGIPHEQTRSIGCEPAPPSDASLILRDIIQVEKRLGLLFPNADAPETGVVCRTSLSLAEPRF